MELVDADTHHVFRDFDHVYGVRFLLLLNNENEPRSVIEFEDVHQTFRVETCLEVVSELEYLVVEPFCLSARSRLVIDNHVPTIIVHDQAVKLGFAPLTGFRVRPKQRDFSLPIAVEQIVRQCTVPDPFLHVRHGLRVIL